MIDLRSDTVTLPDKTMRNVMASAQVGDDVYGEDPTVNRLEKMCAEITGMDAGLFCASGTQSNLLALMTHCRRGDEYIVGQTAHTYRYEAGGAAVLGSIQPQPLPFEPDGSLDLDQVAAFIKPDDYHFAPSTLLCLENTQGGKVLPMPYLKKAAAFATEHRLKFHLDGARLFNAAVKLNIKASDISALFDSVSICLSKGLGAPVGSVLCGDSEWISQARRWRKMVGGGMRQAGILAAAGIHALTCNVARLAEDHDNAARLAEGLSTIEAIDILPESARTNMVFVSTRGKGKGLQSFLEKQGILISSDDDIRLVTHLNISGDDIPTVIEGFKAFFHH